MRKKIYKWIEIEEIEKTKSGKTSIFVIKERNYGMKIGYIKWFSRWRKYAFFPDEETIYEEDCMENIIDFLNLLKQERK